MEIIFIDANIFLEIFLKDSKAEDCKKFLLSSRAEDIPLITTDFILYTCFIQVENNIKDSKMIRETILFFNSLSNLNILRPTIDDMHAATEIMDDYNLDFDDGLVVSCMKNNKIGKLASLDKHFDKVKIIQRVSFK